MINTMNAAKAGIAISLAMTLSACATKLGRDFDDAYARQIKPGETTKAEIREKLGRPAALRTSGDEEIWTYAYYVGKGTMAHMFYMFGTIDPEFGDQGSQKRLVVSFKGNNVTDSKFVVELPRSDR